MARQALLGFSVFCAACGGGQAPPPPTPPASPPDVAEIADAAPPPAPLPPLVTSDKAKVTLKLSQTSFFLGENILVDWCITNIQTSAPLVFQEGGDYRGASRSLRFELTMTDANGVPMPDPDPAHFSMGGLGSSPSLAPGASWCQSLPLVRYARFERPGTYVVRVVHDLGWPKGTAPGGEVTLTLKEPNAVEAEAVVRAMAALPERTTHDSGKIETLWRDFTTLRYDVYRAALLSRAQQGNVESLEGLGQIPTYDATRALIALLGHANVDVARAAADELSLRLPDPALQSGVLGPRNPFFNELPEQRKYLSHAAWRPDLANDVRAAARPLLASAAPADVKHGAFFLEAVGTKDDGPALVSALTSAIDRTATTARETGVAPTPREACQELMRAAEVLLIRGLPVNAAPKTTGELAVWLIAKPRDEAIFNQALAHTNLYVRRVAMERAPESLSAAQVAQVGRNIASSDIDVQLAAISLAQDRHLTTLAPDVVKVITQTQDTYLFGVASRGAEALGAKDPRFDALVGRLTDPKVAYDALDGLLAVFGNNGRSAPEPMSPDVARKVQATWRAFVAAHHADILAEKTLPIDAKTPRDLVPKGFLVHRANQPNWP